MLKISEKVKDAPFAALVTEPSPGSKAAVKTSQSKAQVTKAPTVNGDLATVLAAVRKEKGNQVVVTGNSIPRVRRVPTGIFEFDFHTCGGFPEGRFSIIYGPPSSGKTNLAYKAVAQAQRRSKPNNKAVWVNIEQTFDPVWAAKMGVDVDALIVVNALYGEEAVDLIDALVRAEDVAILVADSLGALISAREVNQSTETADVGTSALLITRLCKKLMIAFAEEVRRDHTPCVILINQIRYKIGVLFGDPETIPGGEAQKFLSSLRIRLYGKDEVVKTVNPNLPAFKDTNCVIKKAKVPIISTSFGYKQCMYAHDGLEIGETRSWTMLSGYLKALGMLEKVNKGWTLEGMLFPTLADAQKVYESDFAIQLAWQDLVIEAYKGAAVLVEEAPAPIAKGKP